MTGEMQERATMFERSSRDLTPTKLGVYGNPTTKNFHRSIEALFRANWPTPYEPLWALAIRFIWIKTILLGVPLVTKLYFFGGKLCILTPIFWASGCVYWHLTLRHLTAGTLGIIHNQLHVPQSSVSWQTGQRKHENIATNKPYIEMYKRLYITIYKYIIYNHILYHNHILGILW